MNKLIGPLLCLCLAGCAPKPAGIVGMWTGTYVVTGPATPPMPATVTFRADGTGEARTTSPYGEVRELFTYREAVGAVTLTPVPAAAHPATFTETRSADSLTLTSESSVVNGQAVGAVFTLRRAAAPLN